jgi:hypothetical protein
MLVLWSFGLFYDHLVYFVAIWYTFPPFGMLYQEKSGNSAANSQSFGFESIGFPAAGQSDAGLPDGIFSNQKSHFG